MGGMGMGGMAAGDSAGQNGAAGPRTKAARRLGRVPALAESHLADRQVQAEAKMRQVGSKTFYFKENRWIDSTVKPEEDAKAKLIRQFSDEFFKLARSQSAPPRSATPTALMTTTRPWLPTTPSWPASTSLRTGDDAPGRSGRPGPVHDSTTRR